MEKGNCKLNSLSLTKPSNKEIQEKYGIDVWSCEDVKLTTYDKAMSMKRRIVMKLSLTRKDENNFLWDCMMKKDAQTEYGMIVVEIKDIVGHNTTKMNRANDKKNEERLF